MRKHVIFTAIAVAAVLFTACESVEIPAPNSDNAIEFRTLVDKNGSTKASLVEETKDLTSFFVTAWLDDDDQSKFMESAVWRVDAGWDYSPKKYFLVDEQGDPIAVDFFAYAPIKDVNMTSQGLKYNGSGEAYFEYEVPCNQSLSNTAVDLLVASATNKTSSDVAFVFNHALSGVTFSATNNDQVNRELVFIVTGIEITNLSNKGTFTYLFDTNAWDPTSIKVAYKAGIPESGVPLTYNLKSPGEYVNLLSANDIMMVLPQKDENGAKVNITYNLKDGSGSFVGKDLSLSLSLTSGFIFAPGTLYNFQFQFVGPKAISFTVELINWAPPTTIGPLNP